MKRFAVGLVLAFVPLVSAVTLHPGEATAQVAVSADSAEVVLWTARAFEADGEWETAEALYRFIADRWPETEAARTALAHLGGLRETGPGRDGQVELQVWTTTYGLWLGVAVPAAFGADGPEPYGVGLLLGGPAGFFAGRALAHGRTLGPGQVRAITFGGTWGTWQGLGWAEVFDIGEEEVCDDFGCFESENGDEEAFASMVVGGLAGLATGALLARRPVSHASATAVNHGALWGTWFGIATGILADLDDEGDDLLAASLIGGNAGLAGTALAAPRLGWSRERYRLVSLAGLIGGLGGAGVDLITTPDDEKVAVAIPLLTSLAGLGIGAALTRGYDARSTGRPGNAALPDGSLLSYRDGRLSVGPPLPVPRVVEMETPRGPERATTLGFTLLRVVPGGG